MAFLRTFAGRCFHCFVYVRIGALDTLREDPFRFLLTECPQSCWRLVGSRRRYSGTSPESRGAYRSGWKASEARQFRSVESFSHDLTPCTSLCTVPYHVRRTAPKIQSLLVPNTHSVPKGVSRIHGVLCSVGCPNTESIRLLQILRVTVPNPSAENCPYAETDQDPACKSSDSSLVETNPTPRFRMYYIWTTRFILHKVERLFATAAERVVYLILAAARDLQGCLSQALWVGLVDVSNPGTGALVLSWRRTKPE